ncbi:uncharacterized protein LOC135390175 [Ornithodoros turicata]|uniref:uncharacterized protein LOC135390175 n=1 Tax=Ornithodoros turicata TaxID=34597 RepID=UPI0031388AE3
MSTNVRSTGNHCVIFGCTNNYRKRKMLENEVCEVHGQQRGHCGCKLFHLHRFPHDDEERRQWIACVNRKDFTPSQSSRVCSEHFVDGRRTERNPTPMINLGYERKVKVGRRRILRQPYLPRKKRKVRPDETQPRTVPGMGLVQGAADSRDEVPITTSFPGIDLVQVAADSRDEVPITTSFPGMDLVQVAADSRDEVPITTSFPGMDLVQCDSSAERSPPEVQHWNTGEPGTAQIFHVVPSVPTTSVETQTDNDSVRPDETQPRTVPGMDFVEGAADSRDQVPIATSFPGMDLVQVAADSRDECGSSAERSPPEVQHCNTGGPGTSQIFHVFPSVPTTSVETQTDNDSDRNRDVATQWEDLASADHTYSLPLNLGTLHSSVRSRMSTSDILFYTGLSEEVFQKILLCLEQSFRPLSQLPLEDQLLLALMRLRLGTLYRDLAWRFSISPSSVCKIFNSVLKSLNEIMKYSVVWLPKSRIQSSMPDSFIQSGYENTRCILDCTEVFLQRPKKQMARAQTYSSYKAHNTLKFLIVIAPNGFIMYVSKAYGGRASDKFIVKDCGILEYFARNDEIMADRGFTLDPYLAAQGVKLNVPAFTRGRWMLNVRSVLVILLLIHATASLISNFPFH